MHKEAETGIHLSDYLKILRQRKWIMIIFFMTIVPFVVVGTFIQKSIYRASSSLIIEMEEPEILKFNDATTLGVENTSNYDRYLNTQIAVVTSKRIVDNVSKDLNLKNIFEQRTKNQEYISPLEKSYQVMMNPKLFAAKVHQLIEWFIPKDDKSLTDDAINIENLKEYNEYYDLTDTCVEELIGKIKVEVARDSQIMYIHVEDEDKILATILANKIADLYIEQNRNYRLKAFSEAQDWLAKKIAEQKKKLRMSELRLQDYREQNNITSYDIPENSANSIRSQSMQQHLKSRLTELKVKLAEYANLYRDKNPKMIRLKDQITETEIALKKERATDLEYQRKGIDSVVLKREVETNNSLYLIMSNRLKEISISSELNVNNIRIKDRSAIPSSPIRPKKVLNILLSTVLGLIGGSGLAFFCNYFDRRIKDFGTVEKDLGLPLLGGISAITNSKCRGIQREIDKAWHVTRYPISHVTEEFRVVRTNIYFSLQGADTKKSIVFTSYGEGEGKTLISTNLSQVLSGGGSKTLLVDVDFRRPKIHSFFDCDNKHGLVTFLQDKTDLDNIIQKTNLPNLYIVNSGLDGAANGGNPFELLHSQRMWDFVIETEKTFDRIIYDLPPIGIINDAFILSSITKAVVLVIEYDKINKENILHVKQLFEKLNVKITGAILNRCPISKDSNYHNYYSYHNRYDALDSVFRPDIDPKLITQSKKK